VVVTPVTSNSGLDAHLPQRSLRTKVGSPFVIAAMEKARRAGKRGIAGFEANGGFFTATPFKLGRFVLAPLPTRDCFLPILAVLASARQAKQPLSSYAAQFALPVALAGRVENYATERSAKLMTRLSSTAGPQAFFASFGRVRKVSRLDGLRVTFADKSVVHLRPSGNAPEFRCYVEAASMKEAEALLARALGLVSSV
jgi:phosphomannomutase